MAEIIQRSPEWYAVRLGRVTASRVGDVIAKTKTGWGASRANYMAELILERLTGTPTVSYINAAMQHGIDTEPEARAAYEFLANCDVQEIGFVSHPVIGSAGCSPDGYVGKDGLVEFKCPQPAQHLATLRGEPIAAKYIAQAQFQMACTDRLWVDWASYSPVFPASMQLFKQRIPRDVEAINDLEREVEKFLREIERAVEELSARYMKAAA